MLCGFQMYQWAQREDPRLLSQGGGDPGTVAGGAGARYTLNMEIWV